MKKLTFVFKLITILNVIILSIFFVFLFADLISSATYTFTDTNQTCPDVEKTIEYSYDTLAKTTEQTSIVKLRNEIAQLQSEIDRLESGTKSQITGMTQQINRKLQLIDNIKANLGIKEEIVLDNVRILQ